MTLTPGEEIAGYRILAPLPRRGLATAYRAYSTAREREVALAILHPAIASEPAVRDALAASADRLTKRRHPNLAQVLGIEEIAGRLAIVSEHVDGAVLADRIANGGRVKIGDMTHVVTDVAAALTYIHGREVVHGQLTPASIAITASGAAVLTGLGVGIAVAASSHAAGVVGVTTPEYASPERVAGSGPTAQDDRYALGVIAYELVAGRTPYAGGPPLAVALAQGNDPLPLPSSIDPRVGEATDRALLKALARAPQDRFLTAREFAETFERAVASDTRQPATALVVLSAAERAELARAAAPARRRYPPLLIPIGGAIAIALVAGLAGFVAGSGRSAVASPVPVAAPIPVAVVTPPPTAPPPVRIALPPAPPVAPIAPPPIVTQPVSLPPPVVSPVRYAVVAGDSLWSIAERLLGSGSRWPDLYARNRATVGPDPDLITPGQSLEIPR